MAATTPLPKSTDESTDQPQFHIKCSYPALPRAWASSTVAPRHQKWANRAKTDKFLPPSSIVDSQSRHPFRPSPSHCRQRTNSAAARRQLCLARSLTARARASRYCLTSFPQNSYGKPRASKENWRFPKFD